MKSGTDGSSDVWVVLVAGEHHSVCKALGGHSSITSIGDAYNTLRRHIPRERIIVIAQLDECRIWHDQPFEEKVKEAKDIESAERQRPMWAEKRVSFWKHMGQMIEEGGADYDGSDVNPDTVLRVILGEKTEKYHKVVDYQDGRTKLFFSLFGHGSWSGRNDNHYFYMPYSSDPVLQSLSQTMRPPEIPVPTTMTDCPDVGTDSNGEGCRVGDGTDAGEAALDAVSASYEQVNLSLAQFPSADTAYIAAEIGGEAVETGAGETSSSDVEAAQHPHMGPHTGQLDESLEGTVEDKQEDGVNQAGAPVAESEVVTDTSTVELDVLVTPAICENVEDPFYQCINSHLPLSGGPRKPFRVHISRYPAAGKPPKSKEELDIQDASILHWQFLFEAFRQIFTLKRPKSVFVFQQSCGSGGMWLWLKENAAYEDEYGCSQWPLFVAYTSEPETSAVGASWGVFFNLLAQVLGEAPVAQSSAPSPLVSISQFYASVTVEYYRVEPFVHHVNLELSEEERAKQSYIKFGVLGTAHGVNGDISESNICTFFLD